MCSSCLHCTWSCGSGRSLSYYSGAIYREVPLDSASAAADICGHAAVTPAAAGWAFVSRVRWALSYMQPRPDPVQNIQQSIYINVKFMEILIEITFFYHYPRPVLVIGYCRCLRLRVRLSLCLSVCLSVCQSLVRTITRDPFKLRSPNLDQRCKRPCLGSHLFCGLVDHDLQGQI